ncbi:MAG: penicillin acylase family protein, partial [bacterium]|nr:penicillin acylase family protein [bacterium]
VREQKEPEIVKVSIAQSGPIIADDGRTVLALAWTGYHGPSSLTAFLQMNRANSVSGVATAWHDVIGPALHIVAADSDGQILHQVAGKVPIRRRGAGRLPAPGEYSQWAWQGFLSFSANPRALNPRDGWIAVAEHDLFLEGDFPRAKPFPADFVPPWQVRRLRDRLGRVDSWTAQMGLELQSDIVSGRAKALLQLLGPQLSHANGSSARSLLAWDGAMEVGETAPAIYARLLEELSKAVGTDEARAVSLPFNPIDSSRLILLLAGGINESWWDDVETSNVESREDIVGHVLSMLDSRPYERWGEIHQVRLSHVLGELPLLGGVLERILSRGPFAVPGDGTTLNSQPAMAQAPFDVVATQSLRFIAQPGRWDDAILVLSGGQSGRPWSPHYDDQIGPWLRAEPVRFVFSEGEVRIATGATLRLEPVAREQELE